jgi:uncharacterized Zn-binding protein involved in type VI secretion
MACVGDSTAHGGFIITGSETMEVIGRKVARQGDMVSCPIPGHGVNPIVEGSDMILDNGVRVALHGHLRACGCKLIALSADAIVEQRDLSRPRKEKTHSCFGARAGGAISALDDRKTATRPRKRCVEERLVDGQVNLTS